MTETPEDATVALVLVLVAVLVLTVLTFQA
jgi:hypothetical protein